MSAPVTLEDDGQEAKVTMSDGMVLLVRTPGADVGARRDALAALIADEHRVVDELPTAVDAARLVPDHQPEGDVWLPAHHLLDREMSMTCAECGGHTSITPPCIPGRWGKYLRADL